MRTHNPDIRTSIDSVTPIALDADRTMYETTGGRLIIGTEISVIVDRRDAPDPQVDTPIGWDIVAASHGTVEFAGRIHAYQVGVSKITYLCAADQP